MILRDKEGRIVRMSTDEHLHAGHSVCAYCDKDMPKVWDTVCFRCGRMLCYDHAKLDFSGHHWVCNLPNKEQCMEENINQTKQHTRYEMLEI